MQFRRMSDRYSANEDSAHHNTAYHNYFEGYTETRVVKPNGRGTKILRVYTGIYYTQDMTDRRWKLNRILFSALYLCSTVLFLLCASLNISSNKSWYVALPEILSFFGLFWMLYILVNYMITPRSMTVGCYRSTSKPIIKSSRLTAAALGLSAFMQLVYMFQHIYENPLSGVLCSVGFFGSSATIFILGTLESHITYKKTHSENKTMGDGVEISR